MTEMTKSPLSGVGGGSAYIDRTVDKVSFLLEAFYMFVDSVPRHT